MLEDLENEIIGSLIYVGYLFEHHVCDCIIDYNGTHQNFHPRSQFPVEKEPVKELNCVNICVQYIENGTIDTNWSKKSVWSGRYLNFNSNTPTIHEKMVVIIWTDRVINRAHAKIQKENLNSIKNGCKNK